MDFMTHKRPNGTRLCKICEKEPRCRLTSSYCLQCSADYQKKYAKQHPKLKDKVKKYPGNSKKQMIERAAKYRNENRAAVNERRKVYYYANRAAILVKRKIYYRDQLK